jgi:hypothetical protein
MSSTTTLPSTGLNRSDWREYWRVHGTSWRSLFEASLDRLRNVVVSACPTCGATPCNSAWCRLCRDTDQRKAQGGRPQYSTPDRPIDWSDSPHLAQLRRLMRNDVSLDAAWVELNDPCNRPTPKSTIEAVMHAVRERGLAALKEPATAERLSLCDANARAEINERIEKLGLKP